jgi:diadenosine tetraphosphate (Ap4A) HIT family hydrolase
MTTPMLCRRSFLSISSSSSFRMRLFISRSSMFQSIMSFLAFSSKTTKLEGGESTTCNGNDSSNNETPPPLRCQYHEPPPPPPSSSSSIPDNHDYTHQNPSIFGKILQGKAPARVYFESDHLLAFQDKHPKAPFHVLVIPKRYIPTVHDLRQDDLALLQEMKEAAMVLLKRHQPKAVQLLDDTTTSDDYRLCYHVPPFNSVHHLHLHVLAPVSEMGWFAKHCKYKTQTPWCIDEERVRTKFLKRQEEETSHQ